tara:strand:+ start:2833 stop:2982 length:150 start_codon:yes stop_codon:yes gene_type:complete
MVHHNYNALDLQYYKARVEALLRIIEKLESDNEYLKAKLEVNQNTQICL